MGHRATPLALADGGEGSLDVIGGANKVATVSGPLGDPVDAGWRIDGPVAHIEVAAASGLAVIGGADNNDALASSTAGTGQLIAQALRLGAEEVVVYHGGSASTDGGWGALEALPSPTRLRHITVRAATDVTTRFVDAAEVFGPQKGASAAEVSLLRRRLERLVDVYRQDFGVEVDELEGAGASGGLAGGLAAIGASIESGFDVLADFVDLDGHLLDCDLVVTGEGRLDETSLQGKLVGRLAHRARLAQIPIVAIAGAVELSSSAEVDARSLAERYGLHRAMTETLELVRHEVSEAVEAFAGSDL